jgi:hypothetical protein
VQHNPGHILHDPVTGRPFVHDPKEFLNKTKSLQDVALGAFRRFLIARVTFEGVDFCEEANGVIDFSGFEFKDNANYAMHCRRSNSIARCA